MVGFDTAIRALQRIDVDDDVRLHHVKLHQVDKRGSTGEIFDVGVFGGRDRCGETRCLVRITRALIDEGAHDHSVLAVFMAVRACLTASTMFG